MALFFMRKEEGEKVIYTPVGKNAALAGYGSLALLGVAFLIYTVDQRNIVYFVFLVLSALCALFMSSFITWIDGLPQWFPPSGRRDGTKMYRLSWEGRTETFSKKDEEKMNAVRLPGAAFKVFVVIWFVGLMVVMWYFWIKHP